MVNLRRNSSGSYSARKRLPDDVREEYGRLYGARYEAKFAAPATVGLIDAKHSFREWEAEVEARIASIRAAQRGDGIDLSREQAAALAGDWYRWFVARHEANPGKPELWEAEQWSIIDAMLQYAPNHVRAEPMSGLEWTRDPEIRANIRPVLADRGHTAQFLASRGVALTNKAQAVFLDFVLDRYLDALSLLESRARNDYAPDDLPRTFPKFTLQQASGGALTPRELFDGWVEARKPAHSTVESWRTVFNTLTRDFPERSASSITPEEAQVWLDKLITEERSAFTVRNTWLRATRTVYRWGARRKLTGNPFAEAVVDGPKRQQHRPKWFYEQERATILKAAAAIRDTSNPDDAACRWVPWLLFYTGARPGEITQLRAQDVQQIDSVWTVNLTPDAGTNKTGRARRVPLHEHLIEQGFLEFASSRGQGPLFYRPRSNGNSAAPLEQKKSPAAQARQRLAAWVREIGVTDEHLSPNHAWRHTFKLIGRRVENDDTILDYICGHAPATVGRGYGEPTLHDMARVIQRFPRFEL